MDRSIVSPRAIACLCAPLLVGGALVLPSLGTAATGGAGLVPPSPGASGGTGVVEPGNTIQTVSGNGITLTSHISAMLRNQLRFTGTVSPAAAGETVQISRLGHETDWAWASTVTATVQNNGTFSAVWQTNHIGRFAIRAVLEPGHGAEPQTTPNLTVTVFLPAIATLYGPGFYGQRTACGERLSKRTLGVANRTLKCGALVAIYYGGKEMIVPVIDRGPYANGANWDLTEATGRALGMTETEKIGAVSLPEQP